MDYKDGSGESMARPLHHRWRVFDVHWHSNVSHGPWGSAFV